MARRKLNEPWLHQPSGYWSKKINGRLYRLDRDYRIAKRKLGELRKELARQAAGCDSWLSRTFLELCEEFLTDVRQRKEPVTYTSYRYRLLRALKHLPSDLKVGEFRRFHLAQVERKLTGTISPTTLRDTLATVQIVFGWAVRQDYLDQNPVIGYEKPRAHQRTRVITPDEFQALLRALWRNAAFRRVLIALRHTGARPSEVRTLTWDMVDLDSGVWILARHKTITKQREPLPRIIPLPDCMVKMCRWLKSRAPRGQRHVFLNTCNKPYSKDRFVKAMAQARKRAGLETKAGEQIVLYTNRHTFATNAVNRVSAIELAELMGHTTVGTTKRYVHLNLHRLKEIRKRAQS